MTLPGELLTGLTLWDIDALCGGLAGRKRDVRRPRRLPWLVQTGVLFMIVNGALPFAPGITRTLGILGVTITAGSLIWQAKRSSSVPPCP